MALWHPFAAFMELACLGCWAAAARSGWRLFDIACCLPNVNCTRSSASPPADVYHCFFVDPSVEMKVSVVDGKRTFDSPDHRKIR